MIESCNMLKVTFLFESPDDEDPEIECPDDILSYSNPIIFDVVATDETDPEPFVECVPSSGTNFPVGNTPVVCTVVDNSYNVDTCDFTVTFVSTDVGQGGKFVYQARLKRKSVSGHS